MNPTIIIPTCKTPEEIAPLMCNLEGHSQGCRIIATCKKDSASVNRNEGIEQALHTEKTEYECKISEIPGIIIMLDDDIAGFYPGWWQDLIKPLEDPGVVLVSARLMDKKGNIGAMMFGGDATAPGVTQVPRVPTACIAFKSAVLWGYPQIRFDEQYKGSGYEDDDFCAQLFSKYPAGKVIINNKCRLIHVNEQKNQGGKFWEHNKSHFESKWRTIRANTIRVDRFYNIPQILHFVWIGSDLPNWARANIDEFKRLNPEFDVIIHDEKILSPMFKKHWDRINHKQHGLAMKSDLLRLSALMEYGGWYFDCDFWPLISIKDMCDEVGDTFGKVLVFASDDLKVCANGIIGCKKYDDGLSVIIDRVLSINKAAPEWWDYGTSRVYDAIVTHPKLLNVQPIKKVIPHVGKKAALEVMKSRELIEKTRAAGAWAIHFEMQTSTDAGALCTIANSDKTSTLTK